jgi:hypothetical protein
MPFLLVIRILLQFVYLADAGRTARLKPHIHYELKVRPKLEAISRSHTECGNERTFYRQLFIIGFGFYFEFIKAITFVF